MNRKIEDPLNLKHDMKISFKIQELDDDFKPQLSDWKTATVLHYNPISEVVTLKGYKERTPAKFAFLTGDNDDDSDAVNSIPWSFLVEPQIIEV
ncbi:hypothetical protein T11_17792 [Trichinella zimbabwensis]|uniref:Uncharacterized protein n=1 Tax=Trichinella zimbabwensis TaxID=268475 RepID=A0A0V1HE35_9BILA|nr:hypothetical protein T11_17792 [Trichinella zimbabwensis]